MPKKKLTKEEYYMNIAREVAQKTKCLRVMIGAVIVKDDQIISTGYVGAPRKAKDCLEYGFCLRTKMGIPHGQRYELCRSVHAEANAIINAARAGVSLLGGDLYLYGEVLPEKKTMEVVPCFMCKKMIINAGLSQVYCSGKRGKIKKYKVADWVKSWQKKDIIDDKRQYGMGLKTPQETKK